MKYSLILNQFTSEDVNGLQVLPFAGIGGMVQLSSLPGDRESNDDTLNVIAPGFSLLGGVDFMYFKYVFLGIQLHGDLVMVPDEYQTINGVSQRVIKGGLDPQLGVLAKAGVHF